MKKLAFYDVPSDYVNYLRDFENSIRGFSRVPLVDYEAHNRKGNFFAVSFCRSMISNTLSLYHRTSMTIPTRSFCMTDTNALARCALAL